MGGCQLQSDRPGPVLCTVVPGPAPVSCLCACGWPAGWQRQLCVSVENAKGGLVLPQKGCSPEAVTVASDSPEGRV